MTSIHVQHYPAVVEKLFSSNVAWSRRVTSFSPKFFSESAPGQQPSILWIGCSDSRVPEGVVTDGPPGHLFTYRNIANQFPTGDVSAESVLEYSVNVLGVDHVVVVGHTNCGGAIAALDGAIGPQPAPAPENANSRSPLLLPTTPIARWLEPLRQRVIGMKIPPNTPREVAILAVIKENVKMQIENILKAKFIEAPPNEAGRILRVHGWLYNLESGLLDDLEFTKEIRVRIVAPGPKN